MLRSLRASLVSVLLGAAALAAVARAQTVDHPGVCAPHERAWAVVANGRDAAAMNRVFAATPAACPGLRRRMSARIVEVESQPRSAPAPAASTRAPPRPQARPAEPLRPVNIPPELRAALTAASYANFERQARRALTYFKPNTIRQVLYDEMSTEVLTGIGVGNDAPNQGCRLRFLPQDSTSAITNELRYTIVRRTPFVAETAVQGHSTMCFVRDATPDIGPSATYLTISVLGAEVSASSSGQEDLELQVELDPSHADTRTSRFRTSQRSGSCRDVRRFGPGRWRPDFPFHVYEMSCQFQDNAPPSPSTTSMTLYYAPELSAGLYCGLHSLVQSQLMYLEQATSNIRVTREADGAVRVKCDYESKGTIRHPTTSISSKAKGEREEIITLQ